MRKIPTSEAAHIAQLARIFFDEKELESISSDLGAILDYIDLLKKADISQVEATSHVLPLKNVFRKDEVRPSLTQQDALSVAVSKQSGCFKVPPVIE